MNIVFKRVFNPVGVEPSDQLFFISKKKKNTLPYVIGAADTNLPVFAEKWKPEHKNWEAGCGYIKNSSDNA